MIAAVLRELNAPLEVTHVTCRPPGLGQVRVQMLATGICGAQLAEIRGEKGNAKFLPHLLGHEGCGIVEEIGIGVTKVKAGDKVVLHWRKGDGIESDFPRYRYNGQEIRSGKVVTFGEMVIASENRVTPVPEDTPVELAALLGCGLSTALATLEHEADLKAGETLLVIGAGGIGVNLLRAAEVSGAAMVTCCDVHEHKGDMVRQMGSRFVCGRPSRDRFGSFDVVVDTVGSRETVEAGAAMLSFCGRMILVGQPKGPIQIADGGSLFAGEGQTIKATQGGGFVPRRDIPRWLRLHRAGKLNVEGIITHRIPFLEINSALDLIRAGNAGRVILTFGA